MKVKKLALKLVFDNAYIRDYLIRKNSKINNDCIVRWIKQFSKVDSISNYDKYRKLVNLYQSELEHPSYFFCVGQESLLYGHINALYQYAGLKFKKPIYLSRIEHGINFYQSSGVFLQEHQPGNYIFQGGYKNDIAHKLGIKVPLYNVGPLIHYAADYYDDETYLKIKKQRGKTLLVFPTHTYELSKTDYDVSGYVNSIYEKYGSSFETIMVCAYWLDIDNPIYEEFKKRGAWIVSAGARFDPIFISRLKTIINLSDEVAINDIGTNIGYALFLKKKVNWINSEVIIDDSVNISETEAETYAINKKRIKEAIRSNNPDLVKSVYTLFWGSEKSIKTKKEIRRIIIKAHIRGYLSLGYLI